MSFCNYICISDSCKALSIQGIEATASYRTFPPVGPITRKLEGHDPRHRIRAVFAPLRAFSSAVAAVEAVASAVEAVASAVVAGPVAVAARAGAVWWAVAALQVYPCQAAAPEEVDPF